ncbi:PIR protein [Plasmodium vivax]|uniref:PIR protein n=1 Tax=Plasmodium vivax TaxID=5855 RepID=A0A564ZTA5_PLAVI|nr:PIR protein [Plasmodium vivax]
MTKPPGKTLEEAAEAVELHKIHPEKFFSELGESSDFDQLCNGIDKKVSSKSAEVKDLCIKLVRHLVKLSKANPSERNNYCSYIRYWLYEKIGAIHADKSAKIENVPFFKDLNDAWTVINIAKLSNKCKPENIKDVKLDELKNRIFSYIYFKNLEKIKAISNSKKQDDCTKHLTYLENFKSLHDKYKIAQCGLFSWTNITDYFSCNHKHELTSLIYKLEKCKNVDKPDPKALPAGKEKDKVVAGQAPLGGQKVSEGTAGPKASVVATSSSSSSTAATTSTVSSPVATTQPGKTTTTTTTSIVSTGTTVTTVTTASAPLTVTSVTTTKASPTVTAVTTTNTVTTRSSSSQGRPSLFSFLLGPSRPTTSERASSLGASQTSSSSSRALGSRASGSSVITTSTPSARGSISSTGQSSRIESSIKPKKRKKKAFEHNYYEEYEKELARYESENESLDSLEDRYYLTYQPDQDSYY